MGVWEFGKTEPVIKVVAMPADTNPNGDMFGGWLLSQMDLAAYLHARTYAGPQIVTVAIDQIIFHRPVFVGDCLICYAKLARRGRTSLAVDVDAIVERRDSGAREQVTEGRFTFVAIDGDRRPVPIAS